MRSAFATLGLLLSLSAAASARVEERTGYAKELAFHSVVRFLRVDRGYRLVEKDLESGYLLFEYPLDKERTVSGSVEVVATEQGSAIVVRLTDLPEYHERVLFRAILGRLRSDYGEPKKPSPAPPKEVEKPRDDASPPSDGREKPRPDAPTP